MLLPGSGRLLLFSVEVLMKSAPAYMDRIEAFLMFAAVFFQLPSPDWFGWCSLQTFSSCISSRTWFHSLRSGTCLQRWRCLFRQHLPSMPAVSAIFTSIKFGKRKPADTQAILHLPFQGIFLLPNWDIHRWHHVFQVGSSSRQTSLLLCKFHDAFIAVSVLFSVVRSMQLNRISLLP